MFFWIFKSVGLLKAILGFLSDLGNFFGDVARPNSKYFGEFSPNVGKRLKKFRVIALFVLRYVKLLEIIF